MQVDEILRKKEGKGIIAIGPDKKIAAVAQILEQEKIGAALVIADSDEILGVISERDIVHGIAKKGAAVLELPVADVMTKSVVTCTPDADTEALMERMLSAHIRHLPVVQDGVPIGVISIGDVVNSVVTGLKRVRDALRIHRIVPTAQSVDDD